MIGVTGIEIPGEKREGIFIRRLNRFVADVQMGKEVVRCHVANTGRMRELLVPGSPVIARKAQNPGRKTNWDLIIAHSSKGKPVLLESSMANRLIIEALKNHSLEGFTGYSQVKGEVVFGSSRFDIELTGRGGSCLIEVKCVTYVEGKVAKFPDAPTQRGRKHVLELIKAKEQGRRAAIIFVVQREDAVAFTPNRPLDPRFADAVNEAYRAGVEVAAYSCKVSRDMISLNKKIRVLDEYDIDNHSH